MVSVTTQRPFAFPVPGEVTSVIAGRRTRYPLPFPVTAYPGENEMYALAKGALRVLNGREIPGDYNPDVKDAR